MINQPSPKDALNHYYEKQDAITRDSLLALKSIVLSVNNHIEHVRKFQIPFFCYKGFHLGFLWVHRKKILVGFVEDKKILTTSFVPQKKDKMSTIEIDPMEDFPIDAILQKYKELIEKYDSFSKITNC